MPDADLIEIRVRAVSATDLDAIRPLARKCGFRHTIADLVRFAIALTANVSRRASQHGTIPGECDNIPRPDRACVSKSEGADPISGAAKSTGFDFP